MSKGNEYLEEIEEPCAMYKEAGSCIHSDCFGKGGCE